MARFHPPRRAPAPGKLPALSAPRPPAVGHAAGRSLPAAHTASAGSRYTGSSRRTDASQTMTVCGQQSLNVLTVLSLLIPAGRASLGAPRRWGKSWGQGVLSRSQGQPSRGSGLDRGFP